MPSDEYDQIAILGRRRVCWKRAGGGVDQEAKARQIVGANPVGVFVQFVNDSPLVMMIPWGMVTIFEFHENDPLWSWTPWRRD